MNRTLVEHRFQALNIWYKAGLLSLVLGASSILSFKMPYAPVSWIVQNQIALIIGFIFGARVGFLSALFLLIEGTCGAPVFSLGRSGPGMILGPSGGYLLAFPLASLFCSWLKNKLPKSGLFTFINLNVSNLIIYFFGILQLSMFVGIEKAMMYGFFPFIALDVVKSVLVTYYLSVKEY